MGFGFHSSQCLEAEDNDSLCSAEFGGHSSRLPSSMGTAWIIADVGLPLLEVHGYHGPASALERCSVAPASVCTNKCTLASVMVVMQWWWYVFLPLSPMGAYNHPNMKPSILFGTAHLACTLWEAFTFLSSCNAWQVQRFIYGIIRYVVRMVVFMHLLLWHWFVSNIGSKTIFRVNEVDRIYDILRLQSFWSMFESWAAPFDYVNYSWL